MIQAQIDDAVRKARLNLRVGNGADGTATENFFEFSASVCRNVFFKVRREEFRDGGSKVPTKFRRACAYESRLRDGTWTAGSRPTGKGDKFSVKAVHFCPTAAILHILSVATKKNAWRKAVCVVLRTFVGSICRECVLRDV